MSANYSLVLSNPNVKAIPNNVVYTASPGGNTIDLIIGNNLGFDVQMGGGSLGEYLLIEISGNIMDATGAGKLAAAAPWKINSYKPPSSNHPFFTFNLLPPAGGVTIPNGQTTTIQLQALQLSAVGIGQVFAQYQFDNTPADNMSVSASLASLTVPNPDLPPLVGDNDALRFTFFINNGASSNPIMVSAQPVTSDNAVDNSIHLNLLYQNAGAGGELVPNWDAAHPPAFRIFFPYFNASDQLPAPLDLTDSLTQADPGYNPVTSAWNIPATLDPTNPNITNDGFWQIELDPNAVVPVWLVTPTPANTHLFTAVQASSSNPGPFLNLYLLSVVSALPIDIDNPETILYLQWNNFPGFNDGLVAYPLQKTELAITSFSSTVLRTDFGVSLSVEWNTTGAFCLISGDSARQAPQAQGVNAYIRALNPTQPLQSSYTLTAVGEDGVTQATKTLLVRWCPNTELPATPVNSGVVVQTTPDGKMVLTLGDPAVGVQFFDPRTLKPLPIKPFGAPDNSNVFAFGVSPDAQAAYIATSSSRVYGYDLGSQQVMARFATIAPECIGPFWIGVSPDSSQVNVVSSVNQLAKAGANQMTLLNSSNLQGVGEPVPLAQPYALIVGPQTGRYYVTADNVQIFDSTLKHVPGSPLPLPAAWVLAVSPDETSLYALLLSLKEKSFVLVLVDLNTLTIKLQRPVGLGYAILTEIFASLPMAALAVSADGTVLFFIGTNFLDALEHNVPLISKLLAFDAQTLEQLPWSPVQFGNDLPAGLAMSPYGTRLYVLASDNIGTQNGTVTLYAVDPEFA